MRKDLKKCVVTEPFLNLVLTCLNGEEKQRDGLVGSMLKQYRITSPQKFGKSQSQGQIIQTTVKANRHRLQIYTVKRQEQAVKLDRDTFSATFNV
uniref:Uncharacterized protein n=1 Tax=Wuchereria bancrofti TaxID=6293 RepID=A0AAF5Q4C8_WUCBA